mgnify:CR=1 FL=1
MRRNLEALDGVIILDELSALNSNLISIPFYHLRNFVILINFGRFNQV